MKKSIYIFFCTLLFLSSCKEKNEAPPVSGEVTIDNETYLSGTYYSYGFSFRLGKEVSTLDDPDPDLTIESGIPEGETAEIPYFAANTYSPCFGFYSGYTDSSAALTAFNALTSFGTIAWMEMGYPLDENQIWIIKDDEGNYSKILITDLIIDSQTSPDNVSCTFKWVYQSDGTATFNE